MSKMFLVDLNRGNFEGQGAEGSFILTVFVTISGRKVIKS